MEFNTLEISTLLRLIIRIPDETIGWKLSNLFLRYLLFPGRFLRNIWAKSIVHDPESIYWKNEHFQGLHLLFVALCLDLSCRLFHPLLCEAVLQHSPYLSSLMSCSIAHVVVHNSPSRTDVTNYVATLLFWLFR